MLSSWTLLPAKDSAEGGYCHQQQKHTQSAEHHGGHDTTVRVSQVSQTTQPKK
jgi:hypothetical protein